MTRKLKHIILGIFDKRQHNRQYMRLCYSYLPGSKLDAFIDNLPYTFSKQYNFLSRADDMIPRGRLYIIQYLRTKNIHCTGGGLFMAKIFEYPDIVQDLEQHGIQCEPLYQRMLDKIILNGHFDMSIIYKICNISGLNVYIVDNREIKRCFINGIFLGKELFHSNEQESFFQYIYSFSLNKKIIDFCLSFFRK